jgi:uncharacterized protein YbcC (UPF0753/DUF2309 family)
LLSVNGWASYARYHQWQAELMHTRNDMVSELLAIRLAWEVVLYAGLTAPMDSQASWHTRINAWNDTCDDLHGSVQIKELMLQACL